jgi:hypothetical protein
MEESIRQALNRALTAVDSLAADVVLRKTAQMDFVPTPFFKRWQVIRVLYLSPTKPLLFYLGAQLPEKAILLTGQPEAFAHMVTDEGVAITDPGLAVDYALTFLEATRSTGRRHTVLNSAADIRFLPHPNAEQSARSERIRQKCQRVIGGPKAERAGAGFLVSCYGIVGADLLKLSLKVKPQGGLSVESQLLESKLPVPYSL